MSTRKDKEPPRSRFACDVLLALSHWRFFVRALSTTIALFVLSNSAWAQGDAVSGIVRDAGGRPISDAFVTIDGGKNSTTQRRTSVDGTFRFIGVSPGAHTIRTIAIGFQPDELDIEAGRTSVDLVIELDPILQALDTVSVRTTRTGIFGTVSTKSPVRGLDKAKVEVLDVSQARGVTGTDGLFSFPKVSGGRTYVVSAEREGYRPRMLSVTVPPDGGVELALFMDSAATRRDRFLEVRHRDMVSRVHWAGNGAAFVPGAELLRCGKNVDLLDALRCAPTFLRTGLISSAPRCVFINGVQRPGMGVEDIPIESIAAVEVYGPGSEYTGMLDKMWVGNMVCGSGPFRRNVGLQPRGTSSRRPPLDSYLRVMVIWLKQ